MHVGYLHAGTAGKLTARAGKQTAQCLARGTKGPLQGATPWCLARRAVVCVCKQSTGHRMAVGTNGGVCAGKSRGEIGGSRVPVTEKVAAIRGGM